MIFHQLAEELGQKIATWELRLKKLSEEQISIPRNLQNRTIKQIVGHMVDSASNNTHRIIHLQYRELPLRFPNYATYGNNDRWIAIQNYQDENWNNLVDLWKFSNLHFIHIIGQIKQEDLRNEWMADFNHIVTLQEMVEDFPIHFQLHLSEIEALIENK